MSDHSLELRNICWNQYKPSYQKFTKIFNSIKEEDGFKVIHHKEFSEQLNLVDTTVSNTPKVIVCRCMDERCQEKSCDSSYHRDHLIDIALPGMGSLLTYAELSKHAELVLEKAKANCVETIELYSHQGCGAAALAKPKYELRFGITNSIAKEVEEYYGCRAYEVFCQVNLDGGYGINIKKPMYQSADQMLQLDCGKCADIHPALGISIIDFQGLDFNENRPSIPNLLKQAQLPLFNITDFGEEFDDHNLSVTNRWRSTAKEVELAGQIIQSDHGMGAGFDYPVVFWVNSESSKQRAKVLKTKIDQRITNPNSKHQFIIVDFQN